MSAKKATKKKASRTTARPRVAIAATVNAPTQPAGELFTTQPAAEEQIHVPAHSVALFINGNNKGVIDTKGQKFGAFVLEQAQRAGIKRFAAYVDGVKADTAEANSAMTSMKKIEIVAKDSRG